MIGTSLMLALAPVGSQTLIAGHDRIQVDVAVLLVVRIGS
jgi:hypothetical protein